MIWSWLIGIWLLGWLLIMLSRYGWLGNTSLLNLLALPWLALGLILAVSALVIGLVQFSRRKTPLIAALIGIALGLGLTLLPTQPEIHYRLHSQEYQREIQTLLPDGQGTHEFNTGSSLFALVYIGNDQPGSTYGSCYGDGLIHKRLAAKWYVCQRDWN